MDNSLAIMTPVLDIAVAALSTSMRTIARAKVVSPQTHLPLKTDGIETLLAVCSFAERTVRNLSSLSALGKACWKRPNRFGLNKDMWRTKAQRLAEKVCSISDCSHHPRC